MSKDHDSIGNVPEPNGEQVFRQCSHKDSSHIDQKTQDDHLLEWCVRFRHRYQGHPNPRTQKEISQNCKNSDIKPLIIWQKVEYFILMFTWRRSLTEKCRNWIEKKIVKISGNTRYRKSQICPPLIHLPLICLPLICLPDEFTYPIHKITILPCWWVAKARWSLGLGLTQAFCLNCRPQRVRLEWGSLR